jgi:hypothetical protein
MLGKDRTSGEFDITILIEPGSFPPEEVERTRTELTRAVEETLQGVSRRTRRDLIRDVTRSNSITGSLIDACEILPFKPRGPKGDSR